MNCAEATRLLEEYTKALSAFHETQEALMERRRGDADYGRARINREEAYYQLTRSRSLYWKHAQMHGCRKAVSRVTERNEILSVLQADLIQARRAFDQASSEFNRLIAIAADASGTQDGVSARHQAQRIHAQAFRVYHSALKRFSDFVLEGAGPEDADRPAAAGPNE